MTYPAALGDGAVVTTTTWLRFAFGDREAILQLARAKQSLWVGLLFVLAAGLAREWDQADLRGAWWHALLPLVLSLATCGLFYGLLGVSVGPVRFPGCDWPQFGALLALWWFTAPLAWLYAIPVERFCSESDAIFCNLHFLALVSLWRVVLMTRVTCVLFGVRWWVAAALVLLYADTVAAAAFYLAPVPIIDFMGGIQSSETDRLVFFTTLLMRLLTTCAWPILALAAAVSLYGVRPRSEPPSPAKGGGAVGGGLWVFAGGLLVLGVALLPLGQPPRRLAGRVERLLLTGKANEAIALMAEHNEGDFPPHWSPPPYPQYEELRPDLLPVAAALAQREPPEWVWNAFARKLPQAFRALECTPQTDWDAYLDLLDRALQSSSTSWADERLYFGFVPFNRATVYPRLSELQQKRLLAIWKQHGVDLLALPTD